MLARASTECDSCDSLFTNNELNEVISGCSGCIVAEAGMWRFKLSQLSQQYLGYLTGHLAAPANRQPPTPNRQPPTANRQPSTVNRQLSKCSGQVISDSLIGFFGVDSRSKALGDKLPSFE